MDGIIFLTVLMILFIIGSLAFFIRNFKMARELRNSGYTLWNRIAISFLWQKHAIEREIDAKKEDKIMPN